MPVCEELSVLDLLKMQVPKCPGCVRPVPAIADSGPQADADLLDILTFAGLLSEGKPAMHTQPNSDAAPQTFFGISLDTKVDNGVEHLASFVQSQTSAQHEVESKKSPVLTPTPSHEGQDHPQLPADTTLTHTPSPSTRHLSGVLSPKQLAPETPGTQQSVLPTAQQHHLAGKAFLPSPNTPKPSSHSSHQKLIHASSPLTSNLELELHPSPSPFFKETCGETLSADNHTRVQVSPKHIEEETAKTAIDIKTQMLEANPDLRKHQIKVDSGLTKDQAKESGSSHSHQMKDSDSCPKKDQEAHLLNSPENQANSDKVRQGKKEKADLDPSINKPKGSSCSNQGHHARLGSGSSKVEDKPDRALSKGQAKDGKPQEARASHSSSRGGEGKAAKSLGKDHTKSDSGSKKGEQSKVVSSCKDQRSKEVPKPRRGVDKIYELPFVSTDEQENRDNEDPRWKKQAVLRTNQERYSVAHRLWRSPCVPDPNRNLTVFGTSHLTAQHSQCSAGNRRHPRKRWHEMDEELQPPRKRQRRFENVRFSVEQIKRSKVVVMNEFLKTLVTPNISRHAAKKLESSHQEKQYMLDLACEEVKAIQMFYDGLPDQDLTVTQEEVERGCQATEHVYQVFSDIYGYGGQEFFP